MSDEQDDREIGVWVIARNNDGETRKEWGAGIDIDSAVDDAVEKVIHKTDDDSYVMDDWGAA